MTSLAPAPFRAVHVQSVSCFSIEGSPIAAFAIDSPRAGDHAPGRGIEINGWVIGRDEPVAGVRSASEQAVGSIHALDVRRPDVAADYPAYATAAASGFSFWVPLDSDSWSFQIEALLATGQTIPLGEFRGCNLAEPHEPEPGHRLVFGPDFAIIGAQRGGTTSLHAYLSAHPQVVNPTTKELHFLTDRHGRGPEWYVRQFPASLPVSVLTGEATPYALYHPRAPRRLREVSPAAKIIVLLRNPVDRAYSHYRLERSHGEEPLSFAEALEAEQGRLAGEENRLTADEGYVSKAHNHASYQSRGDYAPQLERWFAAFPREQFLILRSEDFYEHEEETFQQVTSFLGLPPVHYASFTALNRIAGPPLEGSIRDRLARRFAPGNDRLKELLGRDPGWN